MKKRAVILGAGSFAEVVSFYLEHDSDYDVVGFAQNEELRTIDEFLGRPVVDFENVEKHFPTDSHDLFVAVGYAKLNKVRETLCAQARDKGFNLLSYVCSKATSWDDLILGDNVFIFEDNTIQPFVSIGSGTILWSGNHIGHHATVGAYCFITSHTVVSGHCSVGNRCFLGVNCTIADDISIGDDNLIGPGALIQKSTNAGEAYFAERSKKFPKGSEHFFK